MVKTPTQHIQRYIQKQVEEDLQKKMVFIGGPRQVGKTTLSLQLLQSTDGQFPAYLSWDSTQDRKLLLDERLPSGEPILCLDEIHKFKGWRNLVKGLYDKYSDTYSFLITGSARLDYYRRGGDSLQGRYHYYRLHPLSLGELLATESESDIERLLKFGGFPEPYVEADTRHWRRWQKNRAERLIREDLISLEQVQDLSRIELLLDVLPSKVCSPLSISSLAEDLDASPKTVKRWVQILENLYFCFRIAPLGAPRIRAVKKEQKLYLWDWSLCVDRGSQFENLVAAQLLKYCHFIEDTEGYTMELRYIRDTDGREVDFVVLKDGNPLFAVEAKVSEESISKHLRYFSERIEIPHWYQVHLGKGDYIKDSLRVLPFQTFVKELQLP